MNNTHDENREAVKWSELGAAKGGKARASVLTSQERSDIARQAARSRWAKAGKLKENKEIHESSNSFEESQAAEASESETPYSMFRGTLQMGDVELGCHVLSDGRRVLTQGEVIRAITG